ncbi:MAG: hypothetical protein LBV79_08925, partial [Candidatus Adiutrix sp.]|nr:hypothetical protein [Candidatus Adiutrix sp.]
MKIPILPLPALLALLLLLALPGPLRGEEGSGGLDAFSGNAALRREIWRLAAFPPPAVLGGNGQRSLTVDTVEGLPPVTVNLEFDEFLDPWPSRLEIVFQAEDSEPPELFTLEDRRPFGGPNLRLGGAAPKKARERFGSAP